jgi:hypothetical protein
MAGPIPAERWLLACPKLYMAKDTAIGADMILHTDRSGPMDLKKVLGKMSARK